jgi:deoxyribodipyrimidine photo-lyase
LKSFAKSCFNNLSLKKQTINIVWFKRDLRLQDHAPLQKAIESGLPVLLLYFFEQSVMQYADSDERHWRFVQESINDLNTILKQHKHSIQVIYEEVIPALGKMTDEFSIQQIFSHEETGNAITYERDIAVAGFCKQQNILWHEFPTNGIIRKLKTRKDFSKQWLQTMTAPIFEADLTKLVPVDLPNGLLKPYRVKHPANLAFQPGGIEAASKYLHSFLYHRKENYNTHISKPLLSRKSCSRLSPYLSWGNLSMKQVYQATLKAIVETGDKKNLRFFINRLHWHCHFIQKFESECRMEFENLNTGFNSIRTEVSKHLLQVWQDGQTGYPLVDACMRCVVQTGYLNFRMRSMVVSFLTHHLWQPWQAGAQFLAKQFLDYEPGIHYPQFQMQAGTMGVNTIRIYNPVKQSTDHDAEGEFIKQYVHELQHVPAKNIHEPWLLTTAEQLMYKVNIGADYPMPIVNIIETGKFSRTNLWRTKASKPVKEENQRILKKHTKRKTEKENPLQFNFKSETD